MIKPNFILSTKSLSVYHEWMNYEDEENEKRHPRTMWAESEVKEEKHQIITFQLIIHYI